MNRKHTCTFFVILMLATSGRAQPASAPATMPSLHDLVRSLRNASEPVTPADLRTWPTLSDERNAAVIVWKLDELFRSRGAHAKWAAPLGSKSIRDYTLPLSPNDRETLRKVLDSQQDVLRQLDRISELDGFDWGEPQPAQLTSGQAAFRLLPSEGTCRHQLYLDGVLAVAENDALRAWRRVELMQRIGDAISTHPMPSVAQSLYLLECAADVGSLAATLELNDSDRSPEHRAALVAWVARWLDDRPIRELFVRYLQRERLGVIDALRQHEEGSLMPMEIKPSPYRASDLQSMHIGIPMWPAVIEFYGEIIVAVRGAESLSRSSSRTKLVEAMKAYAARGFVPRHVTSRLGPDSGAIHEMMLQVRARQVLAATAVAIRLYCLDHGGKWPKSLEALVPKYLPTVPLDPTSQEPAPIRYQPLGPKPMIWAAGRNGKDDGGAARPRDVSPHQHDAPYDELVRLAPLTSAARSP
jgi:hypothetical protein